MVNISLLTRLHADAGGSPSAGCRSIRENKAHSGLLSQLGVSLDGLDELSFHMLESFELAIMCSNPHLKPQMRVLLAMIVCYPPV